MAADSGDVGGGNAGSCEQIEGGIPKGRADRGMQFRDIFCPGQCGVLPGDE